MVERVAACNPRLVFLVRLAKILQGLPVHHPSFTIVHTVERDKLVSRNLIRMRIE
jgi:hypothetical protein